MPRKPTEYVSRKQLTDAEDMIKILKSEIKSLENCLNSEESLKEKLQAKINNFQKSLDESEGKIMNMIKSIEAISFSILEYGQPKEPRARIMPNGQPAIVEPPAPVPLERQLGRIEGLLHGFVQKYKEYSSEYNPSRNRLPF